MSKKEAKIKEVLDGEMDHKARIAELEAKLKDIDKQSEESALTRVCKAMGINEEEIKEKEKALVEENPQMVRMWVTTPVNVNGKKYEGDITVRLDTARVIQQAIGDRRMRLLRELTGNNWVLQELQNGGFAPRLISQVDATGERIA